MRKDYQTAFGTVWAEGQFDGERAFKTMRAAFQDAHERHPQEFHQSSYLFGGQSVLIRIVGDRLADHICRPFSHLRIEENHQTPQLTIEFWDDQKARNPRQILSRDNLPWTETTARSHSDLFVGQNLPHTFSCLNRRAGHLMASVAWHDRIFIYERAKPLARLLLEWHNDVNVQVIHAGPGLLRR